MTARTKRSNSEAQRGNVKGQAVVPTDGQFQEWPANRIAALDAPGRPGAEPRWAPAAKDGVGTAIGPNGGSASRVWFTICEGILTEVFYPRVDQACIRDLGCVVTDGSTFFSDERLHCEHKLEYPNAGVPLYRVNNTCRQGAYQLEKTFFTHPRQDAVLQAVRFSPEVCAWTHIGFTYTSAPDLANRVLAYAGWVFLMELPCCSPGETVVCSRSPARWLKGSAGYVGVSDGWRDLAENHQLTHEYSRADDGNVGAHG